MLTFINESPFKYPAKKNVSMVVTLFSSVISTFVERNVERKREKEITIGAWFVVAPLGKQQEQHREDEDGVQEEEA